MPMPDSVTARPLLSNVSFSSSASACACRRSFPSARSGRLCSTMCSMAAPSANYRRTCLASKLYRRLKCCSSKEGEGLSLGKRFMKIFGRAAEIANGRVAMLGFVWGVSQEVSEHKAVMEQLMNMNMNSNNVNGSAGSFSWVCFISVIFTVASLVPMLRNFGWSGDFYADAAYAELLNGRLAMLGFLFLVALECCCLHSPLFA